MATIKCHICQEREAIKSITTSLDDGSFYVCEKKKCSREVYKMLKDPPASLNASLADSSHNPMDWQGRSLEKVREIELIAFWSFLLVIIATLLVVVWNIFS